MTFKEETEQGRAARLFQIEATAKDRTSGWAWWQDINWLLRELRAEREMRFRTEKAMDKLVPGRVLCACRDYATESGVEMKQDILTDVGVRWLDGYLENFRAREVRFGGDLLWIKLAAADGGGNRHIPLRQVRCLYIQKVMNLEGIQGMQC